MKKKFYNTKNKTPKNILKRQKISNNNKLDNITGVVESPVEDLQ